MRYLGIVLAGAVAILGLPQCNRGLDPETFSRTVQDLGGRVSFVFERGQLFRECHASTLAVLEDGGLLCCWFGGTQEGNDDVAIWWAMLHGDDWSNPAPAAKVRQQAHWNPVLFRDSEGDIHLFFRVGANPQSWSTYLSHWENQAGWSTPVELVAGDIGGRGPSKNKPLILSNGDWLAPGSSEAPRGGGGPRWRPFADTSQDQGLTWQRSADFPNPNPLPWIGAIQPAFWESAPGQIHALMRTQSLRIWRSDSRDYGRNWSPMYATKLPSNNSGLDLLRLEDGRVVLLYNPIGFPGLRNVLALSVSDDNGRNWRTVAKLEHSWNPFREFSYPSVIRTSVGIAVSYTWRRERIRCWEIPLEAL